PLRPSPLRPSPLRFSPRTVRARLGPHCARAAPRRLSCRKWHIMLPTLDMSGWSTLPRCSLGGGWVPVRAGLTLGMVIAGQGLRAAEGRSDLEGTEQCTAGIAAVSEPEAIDKPPERGNGLPKRIPGQALRRRLPGQARQEHGIGPPTAGLGGAAFAGAA